MPHPNTKISLLIPTKNRANFLSRLLNYYADLNFQGHLLIGDSSEGEHLACNHKFVQSLAGQLKITHQEYPNLSAEHCGMNLVRIVQTPYAAWLPDDDFLVPASIEKCINFLETHPDYNAAAGVSQKVALDSETAIGNIIKSILIYLPTAEQDNATERFLSYMTMEFGNTVHCVHRIEPFRMLYKVADESKERIWVGSYLPDLLLLLIGKVKVLDCLYLIQQIHGERLGFKNVRNALHWLQNESWAPSAQVFLATFAKELAKQDGLPLEETQKIVEQGFWFFLNKRLVKYYQRTYQNSHTLLPPLNDILPSQVKHTRTIRKSINYLHRFGVSPVLVNHLQKRKWIPEEWSLHYDLSLKTLLDPRSRYHEDFMPIYQAITSNNS